MTAVKLPLLMALIRLYHCQEAITFMKRRAAIGEEYAKSMLKLSRDMKDHISEGSLGAAWTSVLDVTSGVGDNRMALALSINEELSTVFKDCDIANTYVTVYLLGFGPELAQLKDAGTKQQKFLSDQGH